MKFRVIVEVIFNDGTADKTAMYTLDSEDLALKGFYQYMGQYVGVANVSSVNVIAKNSVGGIYKNEAWTQPVVEDTTEDTSDDTTDNTEETA